MRKLILWLLSVLLFSSLLARDKKPFSIEALYRIKSVGDAQISPDGRKIVYVVTENDLTKGKRYSDIYVMDVDGRNQRQLTTYTGSDWHPRWSPDGTSVLFLSTRKDGVQMWKLPMNGGDSRQLSHLDVEGLSDVRWMPDGKHVVFYTDVFPECGADLECNAKIRNSLENGPLQAHYATSLLYRHWTYYRDGRATHMMLYNIETGELKDLTPGTFDFPMFSLGGPMYDIAPDGSEIVVVSNHDAHPESSTNGDLFIINLKSGAITNITSENKAFDGEPVYSPNGRYIAYKLQKIPTYESDRFRLAVYDRKTGKSSVLTENYDNMVGEIVWSPDSKYLYFTGQEEGNIPVYKISVKGGKWKTVMSKNGAKYISSLQLAPNGKFFVFSRRSIEKPGELYTMSVSGKNLKQITFWNQKIEEEYDIRPAEEMWIDGADGVKIHTYVIKPHGFEAGKKYPLILNVHGGPQMMWSDAFRGDWQVYPGSGYIVAFCNPHGSTGYGQEFTAAISKDWGGKVYEDVVKVAEHLGSLDYVDENRMGAMGWSYGGYMMMWLQGHKHPFKAMVAMMGVYDLRAMYGATEELWFPEWELNGTPWESKEMYNKWSPSNYVTQFKTPTLVITGERDYRVPYTQSLEYFTDLQKMGVPSELIVFKNDGHWPNYVKSMPMYYNAHLYWFHKYLGGDKEPYDMLKMFRNQAFEK